MKMLCCEMPRRDSMVPELGARGAEAAVCYSFSQPRGWIRRDLELLFS